MPRFVERALSWFVCASAALFVAAGVLLFLGWLDEAVVFVVLLGERLGL